MAAASGRRDRRLVVVLVVALIATIFGSARNTATAASYDLVVSTSPDRLNPSLLDGATVAGDIAVFTTPEVGVTQVRFRLDGALHRTESNPPFDFDGGSVAAANLFATTTLSDGPHTITAEIDDAAGTTTIAADFTVANAAPALDFAPNTLVFNVDEGGSTPPQAVSLDTTDGTTASFSVSDDADWLSADPLSGSTAASLNVDVDATGLTVGTYAATLTATAPGFTTASLPVTLFVGDGGDLPITGITWTTATPVPIARTEAQGGAVDGKLFIFGGYVDVSPLIATTRSDVYDPLADTWTRLGDMPAPTTHAATVVDGTDVYLVGGYDTPSSGDAISTDAVWKYDTLTETWTSMPPLPEPRASGGAALFGRDLHYFGGADAGYVEQDDHWVLSLDGGGWTTAAPLSDPKTHMGVAKYDGKVYVFGGEKGGIGGTDQTSVQVWDPAFPNTWTTLTPLPIPLSHTPGATLVIGDQIILVGGETNPNTAVDAVHVYDPIADSWATLTDLPDLRKAGMGGVFSGEIIYAGGSRLGGAIQTTTYRGVPTTGGGAPPGSYDLRVSSSPDRSGSVSLDGATVAGDIAVFTTPDAGVDRVRFFIDGSLHRTENNAPFDFDGGSVGSAKLYSSTDLSDGGHTITAEIDDAAGTATIVAAFTVANTAPSLIATPQSVALTVPEGETGTDTATITAGDGAAVDVDVTDDAAWLTVTPTTGTTPFALDLSADTSGLAPGDHTATVTITDPGGGHLPATLLVELTVVTTSLVSSPGSLSFSVEEGGADTQVITIEASDGSTVAFDTATSAPWLTAAPLSADTPQAVTVTVDTTGLAPDTYNATVTATDPTGGYDPTIVPVQLTVTEPTQYQLLVSDSPDRTSPTALQGATVAGDIYVFVEPSTGIDFVDFWVNDPTRATQRDKLESNAPFDLAGTAGGPSRPANPYDSTQLIDGANTVTAEVRLDDGSTEIVHATFTVAHT